MCLCGGLQHVFLSPFTHFFQLCFFLYPGGHSAVVSGDSLLSFLLQSIPFCGCSINYSTCWYGRLESFQMYRKEAAMSSLCSMHLFLFLLAVVNITFSNVLRWKMVCYSSFIFIFISYTILLSIFKVCKILILKIEKCPTFWISIRNSELKTKTKNKERKSELFCSLSPLSMVYFRWGDHLYRPLFP